MNEPLYPERHIYHVEDNPEAPRVLEAWVLGKNFHLYVPPRFVSREDRSMYPPDFDLRGEYHPALGYVRWSLRYQRGGEPDSRGFHSGGSGPNGICYAALSLIEEHDREWWLVAQAVAQ